MDCNAISNFTELLKMHNETQRPQKRKIHNHCDHKQMVVAICFKAKQDKINRLA